MLKKLKIKIKKDTTYFNTLLNIVPKYNQKAHLETNVYIISDVHK